jgi:hypothetical protein
MVDQAVHRDRRAGLTSDAPQHKSSQRQEKETRLRIEQLDSVHGPSGHVLGGNSNDATSCRPNPFDLREQDYYGLAERGFSSTPVSRFSSDKLSHFEPLLPNIAIAPVGSEAAAREDDDAAVRENVDGGSSQSGGVALVVNVAKLPGKSGIPRGCAYFFALAVAGAAVFWKL